MRDEGKGETRGGKTREKIKENKEKKINNEPQRNEGRKKRKYKKIEDK